MDGLLTILREVRDPRDMNARHNLAAILFIALSASLCGAKNCVEYADFGSAHETELGEIVDLPHGSPAHDCFSRVFRKLDPKEVAGALSHFAKAMRAGLGLDAAKGVIAIACPGEGRGEEPSWRL